MSDDQDKQSKQFFGNSWLGRVLRGEEKLDFETSERPEYPKFAETAQMSDDGKIEVRRRWYGPDGGKAIANIICEDAESVNYQEIMSRHPDLAPHKPSTYFEYHDGRWELGRAGQIIARGQKDDLDPLSEK